MDGRQYEDEGRNIDRAIDLDEAIVQRNVGLKGSHGFRIEQRVALQ